MTKTNILDYEHFDELLFTQLFDVSVKKNKSKAFISLSALKYVTCGILNVVQPFKIDNIYSENINFKWD